MRSLNSLCCASLWIAFFCAIVVCFQKFLPTVAEKIQHVVIPLRQVESHFLAPVHLTHDLKAHFYLSKNLANDFQVLQQENFVLQSQMNAYETIVQENQHLKTILDLKNTSSGQIEAAYVFPIPLAAQSHFLLLSKGKDAELSSGDLVFNADGVVGVIENVDAQSASFIPVYDSHFGLAVEIVRNGTRSIMQGSGRLQLPRLLFLPETADVAVGDKVVTSGVDGLFARGYPVGVISDVKHNESEAFLEVHITPYINTETLDYVLVLKANT